MNVQVKFHPITLWKLSLLKALANNPLRYSRLSQNNGDASWALIGLRRDGLIEAWGPEWKAALFVITDKGRRYLRDISARQVNDSSEAS